jgi:hypothetical protein
MTLTYSLDHVLTSVEDVSIEVADKAALSHQKTSVDPKTGEQSTVYVIANGDTLFKSYVTFRYGLQNRGGQQVRRIAMQFDTWATKSDSVSGLDTKQPIQGMFQMLLPGDMLIEIADLDDFIGNCFSYLYASVTTKVRSTAWLSDLSFGITEVI